MLCAYKRRKCTKYDICEFALFSYSVSYQQLHMLNYFRFAGCHCSKGHLPLTSFLYWHCKLLIQIDVTSAMFVSSKCIIYTKTGMCGSRGGGGRGSGPPSKNSKNIGFLSNSGPDPLTNHEATKPVFNVGPLSARQQTMMVRL